MEINGYGSILPPASPLPMLIMLLLSYTQTCFWKHFKEIDVWKKKLDQDLHYPQTACFCCI